MAFWLASLMPEAANAHLVVRVSLATVFFGLLLLTGRKTTVSQLTNIVAWLAVMTA
ncbi:MAG: hypothetical protein HY330_05040 [Chloroflexi bacterium]|nr:hypothetical protein [Chloroflexota bacterium]